MKTRIIKTKFWTDEKVGELEPVSKLLFIYLITSQYIGLCSIFECSDRTISFYTGLNSEKLGAAQEKLENMGRVYFYRSWVWVVNAERHNRYLKSPLNATAYKRDLAEVPEEVMSYFESKGYTSMHSTINSRQK